MTTTQKPRRTPGLGTIREFPSGSLRWEVMVEGRRFSGTCKTKKEAQTAISTTIADAARGGVVDPSTVTVEEYLTQWLQGRKASRALRTHQMQEGMLRLHIAPALGKKRLQKLSPAELRRFFDSLNTERVVDGVTRPPLGRSSQRLIHQFIHQAFKDALEVELIPRNIAMFVKPNPPRERDDEELDAFTPDEAARFLEAARADPWGGIFEFALSAGMRRGELVGLRWQDIDWEAGTLHIRENVVKKTASMEVVSTPKTRGSRRTVHLSASSLALLRRIRQWQADMKERFSQPVRGHAKGYQRKWAWADSGRVFVNSHGATLAPDNLRRDMLRICAAAGVRPLPIHALRHTYASLSLMRGVPPEVVSKQLGHSTVAFTLTLYRTVYTGEREAWAMGVDELVSRDKK